MWCESLSLYLFLDVSSVFLRSVGKKQPAMMNGTRCISRSIHMHKH